MINEIIESRFFGCCCCLPFSFVSNVVRIRIKSCYQKRTVFFAINRFGLEKNWYSWRKQKKILFNEKNLWQSILLKLKKMNLVWFSLSYVFISPQRSFYLDLGGKFCSSCKKPRNFKSIFLFFICTSCLNGPVFLMILWNS